MGSNFDAEFLQTRCLGLNHFIQHVLGSKQVGCAACRRVALRRSPRTQLAEADKTRSFFFDTPRHGRGPKYALAGEVVEEDTSVRKS